MAAPPSDAELQPSKLGTKEHWDNVYSSELANFKEIGDEGEIWFGEESVEKMVDWALEHIPPPSSASPSSSTHPTILEIGSGNGTLLFALAEAGYAPTKLCGIDYSADAVALAKSIAQARGGGLEDITFEERDFLTEEIVGLSDGGKDAHETASWDLVLDKGTYDAIALGEKDEKGLSPAAGYPARAARLLKPGGFFLITSCNFTEEELKASFTAEGTMEYHSRVKHRTFSFGGQSGSVVCTVAFRKIDGSS
ncbi:S-adenosyl-L-methionine-dependent methyltransferase [Schizophyllum commune H4-8]|uniref:Protein-lysine N-methyltransferase EFM4 n=1 Tax=Schizophyllum commune (strain H4-8 / FGSC 9210) TaxID=578458 RepID=D8Q3X6_SCHCM|nr:S-adenosyl-L-methionine-dependent methyltransferase [Schizophyllum commune H4-8]KAI5892848.1 S-adenosyl-L-methionine-dependent methyltransferase [Schizophyllum commune H4-8]